MVELFFSFFSFIQNAAVLVLNSLFVLIKKLAFIGEDDSVPADRKRQVEFSSSLKMNIKEVSRCSGIDWTFLAFPLSRYDLHIDFVIMVGFSFEFVAGKFLISWVAKLLLFAQIDPELESEGVFFL